MYTVSVRFADLEDHNHIYEIGDAYPREGYAPSEERVEALLTDRNRVRKPLIQPAVSEEQAPAAEAAAEELPKKRTKKNA